MIPNIHGNRTITDNYAQQGKETGEIIPSSCSTYIYLRELNRSIINMFLCIYTKAFFIFQIIYYAFLQNTNVL